MIRSPEILVHLCGDDEWHYAQSVGEHRPPSLDEVGFVHLSAREQVHLPANRLYPGRTDLVLLNIDPAKLTDPVRWEPGVPTDPESMLFPHLYGPLPVAAVTSVTRYLPDADGRFAELPATAPVAVVTGASRGAGRGIADALAAHGWRVYATGRTITEAPPGGVAVRMDHADDDAVAALFARVEHEAGRLDLLVNNAAVIHDELTGSKPFWEKPIELGDVLDVGLRSAYIASWYAAPLLVRQPRALIAFTSSPGAVCYMHGPAYGAQKAGIDKMAADMAVDFEGSGVACVSIWMGILLTEKFRAAFDGHPDALARTAEHAETPEFTGHLIDALYLDPDLAGLSGHTVIGAELAARYGITDEGGRTPPSHREKLGSPREPSIVVLR